VLSTDSKNEEIRSYKNIFKATTLFGGVQLYQILISVIRSKFVAVLLGTAGMGIQGLYQSTLSFIQSITSLGLSSSAVRDVSEANGSGDTDRISRTVTTLKRLVWFTGLFGMVAVMALSPVLSKATFGNYDYTIPLIVLSCTLLFEQLASGGRVVLQGMRRLKDLARASAAGATAGLVISVPIYYIYGIKGIVPTLVLSSVTGMLIMWLFSRRVVVPKVELSGQETWHNGRMMIKMGLAMSASGIMSTGVAYVIRSYIMHSDGTSAVGLFQAGFVIINTYVGMVFSAIGTDYYPRLAAANKENGECRRIVSQQGEIATHILAPLLCGCILLMPVILRVLYSEQFLEAEPFVLWCCPGMMLRMASWLIAFQFVAKAESGLFITTEVIGNLVYMTFSILGYKLGGLTGLGIAFTCDYLVYTVIVYAIAARRYGFSFSREFNASYLLQSAVVIFTLAAALLLPRPVNYWICAVITLVSCVYALVILERKMEIMGMLKGLFKLKTCSK
jgi:PST family polysaccharide transporter